MAATLRTRVLHKEVHPPTGVTTAVVGHLTRPPAPDVLPDLVIVRSTLLEVYYVRQQEGGPDCSRLELLHSAQLHGVVESAAVLASATGQRGALLLAFRDAKLSVCAWDAGRHELLVTSLHYYEGDGAVRAGRALFPYGPRLAADPQGRAAAMLFFRHQLALLPAVDADVLEALMAVATTSGTPSEPPSPDASQAAAGDGCVGLGATAVGNSYVINLGKQGMKEVRDCCFLQRYNEPVLLLLHEQEPTWTGRYMERKDTCALTALSVNVATKRHPRLWAATGLPSDAFRVSAVPAGGTLVLCLNHVLYYSQGASLALSTHPSAAPGVAPPPMHFDPMAEHPSITAAKFGRQYATNVHPDAAAAVWRTGARLDGVDVELRGGCVAWASDTTALVALRAGALLTLTLQVDAGSVRAMAVTRAGGAPPASCLAALGPQLMFLGSWAGDSLLIAVGQARAGASSKGKEDPAAEGVNGGVGGEAGDMGEGGPAKRQRLEVGDAAVELGEQTDEDEVEAMLYSTAAATPARSGAGPAGRAGSTRLAFKVADSLTGCSPIHDCTLGDAGMPLADSTARGQRPQALVAAVGNDRSGALTVLRRQLAADVITEVPLPGVAGAWALRSLPTPAGGGEVGADGATDGNTGGGGGGGDAYHAYLLLGISGATQVLDTSGEELQEVTDRVQYDAQVATIAAGDIAGGTRMVQVTPTAVRLLNGLSCEQELSIAALWDSHRLPGGAPTVAAAAVADPHLLLHASNGAALLLRSDAAAEGRLQLQADCLQALQQEPSQVPGAQITAAGLFEDHTCWLAAQLGEAAAGDGCYCIVARAAGTMQLYALPGMRLVATYRNVCAGERLMVPVGQAAAGGGERAAGSGEEGGCGSAGSSGGEHALGPVVVVEVRMESYGAPADQAHGAPACERPLLLLLTSDDELLPYQLAALPGQPEPALLRQRLNWLPHRSAASLRDPAPAHDAAGADAAADCNGAAACGGDGQGGDAQSPADGSAAGAVEAAGVADAAAAGTGDDEGGGGMQLALTLQPLAHMPSSRLVRFDGLGEGPTASGVFVCGERPLWIVAARGGMASHPMDSEGAVLAFTPFHNINCPRGFIIATGDSSLRICSLPPRVRLDAPWTLQRVALRATPHAVAYYPQASLFAVLTSRQVPYKPWVPEEVGGDAHASFSYATADAAAKARGTMLGYEVRILQPGLWNVLWRQQLMSGEMGITVAPVSLKKTSTDETQPLLAVGTASCYGEDYPCSGRVLFFEITRAGTAAPLAAGGVAMPRWSVQQLYSREFRGPVTAIASLDGFLLVGCGTRVEVHTWTGSSLQRFAFFDAPTYVTSLNIVKHFILFGDVHKGLHFLWFKEAEKKLAQLGKDFDNSTAVATEFIINGSVLTMLEADAGGTLRTFEYRRKDPLSWAGSKLMPQGVFHIGHRATRCLRQRLACADGVVRHASLYATADGTLGLVSPLWDEAGAAALQRLQIAMAHSVVQPAGLNPVAFRQRHSKLPVGLFGGQHFGAPLPRDGFLDGDLLWRYATLPLAQQEVLAKAAGTGRRTLLRCMHDLARAAACF